MIYTSMTTTIATITIIIIITITITIIQHLREIKLLRDILHYQGQPRLHHHTLHHHGEMQEGRP
jgi:hypothetical protein